MAPFSAEAPPAALVSLEPPGASLQIAVDRHHATAFELELVIHARDGRLAPPFVVDAPAVLYGRDWAHGAFESLRARVACRIGFELGALRRR